MFIVVTFLAFSRPMPGAPRWVHELASVSFEAGMVMGLIAPVLAIIGAILCFLARRRLTALDWVSLAFGLVAGLLPAMFIYAYSNCPDGVC